MPFSKLEHLLDANHVRYTKIRHSPAYTAQEIAAAAHVPGRGVEVAPMIHPRMRVGSTGAMHRRPVAGVNGLRQRLCRCVGGLEARPMCVAGMMALAVMGRRHAPWGRGTTGEAAGADGRGN